jgi:hypothetical protein
LPFPAYLFSPGEGVVAGTAVVAGAAVAVAVVVSEVAEEEEVVSVAVEEGIPVEVGAFGGIRAAVPGHLAHPVCRATVAPP